MTSVADAPAQSLSRFRVVRPLCRDARRNANAQSDVELELRDRLATVMIDSQTAVSNSWLADMLHAVQAFVKTPHVASQDDGDSRFFRTGHDRVVAKVKANGTICAESWDAEDMEDETLHLRQSWERLYCQLQGLIQCAEVEFPFEAVSLDTRCQVIEWLRYWREYRRELRDHDELYHALV